MKPHVIMDARTQFRLIGSELSDLLKQTTAEIEGFNELVGEKDTPVIRRLRVRVMFACVESHLVHLKRGACMFNRVSDTPTFSEPEMARLEDAKFRISLKENVTLAFDSFAKVFGKPSPLDKNSRGWNQFLGAINIRDRITHPKSHADWVISDADNAQIGAAWDWFGMNLVKVSEST